MGEAISSLPLTVRVAQALVGTEGAGDGCSVFLDVIKKFEAADELISEAFGKAQTAAATADEALEAAKGASGATAAANAAAAAATQARGEFLVAAERGDFDGEPGAAGTPPARTAPTGGTWHGGWRRRWHSFCTSPFCRSCLCYG